MNREGLLRNPRVTIFDVVTCGDCGYAYVRYTDNAAAITLFGHCAGCEFDDATKYPEYAETKNKIHLESTDQWKAMAAERLRREKEKGKRVFTCPCTNGGPLAPRSCPNCRGTGFIIGTPVF